MASKSPLRTLVCTASSHLRTPQLARKGFPETSACAFSTSTHRRTSDFDGESVDRPRWQQTPPRMQAPFRIRPQPQGPVFKVNEDPKRLDDVYVRVLGQGGDQMLSEEVKWLAVTHKSFDHGRRGNNDRLALMGRQIVSVQTTQGLLAAPQAALPEFDQYGRKISIHPALRGLTGVTREAIDNVLDKKRLGPLGERYGLDNVTRWKPKRTDNLIASGQNAVLSTSLYAIIGAIALERGALFANTVARNKILAPLGFTFPEEIS